MSIVALNQLAVTALTNQVFDAVSINQTPVKKDNGKKLQDLWAYNLPAVSDGINTQELLPYVGGDYGNIVFDQGTNFTHQVDFASYLGAVVQDVEEGMNSLNLHNFNERLLLDMLSGYEKLPSDIAAALFKSVQDVKEGIYDLAKEPLSLSSPQEKEDLEEEAKVKKDANFWIRVKTDQQFREGLGCKGDITTKKCYREFARLNKHECFGLNRENCDYPIGDINAARTLLKETKRNEYYSDDEEYREEGNDEDHSEDDVMSAVVSMPVTIGLMMLAYLGRLKINPNMDLNAFYENERMGPYFARWVQKQQELRATKFDPKTEPFQTSQPGSETEEEKSEEEGEDEHAAAAPKSAAAAPKKSKAAASKSEAPKKSGAAQKPKRPAQKKKMGSFVDPDFLELFMAYPKNAGKAQWEATYGNTDYPEFVRKHSQPCKDHGCKYVYKRESKHKGKRPTYWMHIPGAKVTWRYLTPPERKDGKHEYPASRCYDGDKDEEECIRADDEIDLVPCMPRFRNKDPEQYYSCAKDERLERWSVEDKKDRLKARFARWEN